MHISFPVLDAPDAGIGNYVIYFLLELTATAEDIIFDLGGKRRDLAAEVCQRRKEFRWLHL